MPKYQLDTTAEVPSRAALRSFTGRSNSAVVSQGDDAGVFRCDESDLTSADDDLDTVVDYLGRRWKRLGLGSLSFQQSGTGAVTRTAQAKLRDIVSVFDFMTTTEIADVQAGTALVEVTTALAAAVATAGGAGKTLYFPKGTYLTGRIFPKSSTTIWMDGGGVTLKRKAEGINILRLTDVNDVHIYCNGATLDGSNTNALGGQNQPVVYMEGAVRCSLRDANIIGPSDPAVVPSSQDGIYIGGGAVNLVCEDVVIRGGSIRDAKRNGISVVSALNTLIEGVEIYDTLGNPGAGIDVEANAYDKCVGTTIRKCRIHDNGSYGIVVSFSDQTNIDDNEVYDNGIDGIATSVSNPMFATATMRSNVDVRGVSAFDTATGRVSLGGDIDKLQVGTVVQFATTGAGAVPVTLQAQSRWFVHSKVAGSTTDVILSAYFDYDPKTTLSDAGAGTLNADPALSEVTLRCYVEGQCSNIHIHHNYVHGNALKAVDMGLAVNVSVHDNRIYHGGTLTAVEFALSRKCSFRDNRVKRDTSGPANTTGVYWSQSSYLDSSGNDIRDFSGYGILCSGAAKAVFDNDCVTNCGTSVTYATAFLFGTGLRVSDLTVYNDERITATYGVYTDATLTSSVFRGVVAKNAGSSNANSLVLGSNRGENCVMRDGTFGGAGGAVVQATSKATGVTLNTQKGQITMNAAALAATTTVSFTLTNSLIGANDTVVCHRKSGGTALAYEVWVESVASGSCVICVRNVTGGSLSEAPLLQFAVIAGAVA